MSPVCASTVTPLASHPLLLGFAFIIGACVGSFLNVVALRQLADEEFVKTPSHCPQCGYTLKWYDNIPILSWLLLMGKCRACKSPVHWQYPLVELITGLLFVAVLAQFGLSWLSLALLPFISTLIVMTITDFREHVIFTLHALWLIPLGLLIHGFGLDANQLTTLAWVPPWTLEGSAPLDASFYSALFGVAGIFLVFEGLIWLSRVMVGQDGFGHGDTLILMAIAAFLGWEQALASLVLGAILTAMFTLPMMFIQWARAGHWGLLWKMGGALLLTAAMYGLSLLTLSPLLYLAIASVILITTVLLLLQFMREKQAVGGFTAAPFGPGLMAGAVLLLFFGQRWMPQLMGLFS